MANRSLLSHGVLGLAELGYRVHPLNGKVPLTSHGCLDATDDPEQVRAWWRRWPDANVGLATGHDGLVAIDCDVDKGGRDTLADLKTRLGPLPPTVAQKTPKGGSHGLFRANVLVSNSAGKLGGPGVDIRGDKGLIVVAPSLGYTWTRSPFEFEPADLPVEWAAALREAAPPSIAKGPRRGAGQSRVERERFGTPREYAPLIVGGAINARRSLICPAHDDHEESLKVEAACVSCYVCGFTTRAAGLLSITLGLGQQVGRTWRVDDPEQRAVRDARLAELFPSASGAGG